MATSVELVVIGDELLSGTVSDANTSWLSRKLTSIGLELSRVTIISDKIEQIKTAFTEGLARSEIVISCGGLGPTDDDLTRQAVAELFNLKLTIDPELLSNLRTRLEKLGRKLSAMGERQALIPEGALLLPNPVGAAPGIILSRNQKVIVLLPGVPGEMQVIAESGLLPYLKSNYPETTSQSILFRTAGTVETDLAERLKPVIDNNPELGISYLPKPGRVDLRIKLPRDADREAVLTKITSVLGNDLYSTEEAELSRVVGQMLSDQDKNLSVAESCSGGLLASSLIDNPGSSTYFLGGVVSYSDKAKQTILDVPAELITKHGAASSQVAKAMAEGARSRFKSDYALSTTGIAGPGGGTDEKPVGLVYIGLATVSSTRSWRFMLPGDRRKIRERTVVMALDLLRRNMIKNG